MLDGIDEHGKMPHERNDNRTQAFVAVYVLFKNKFKSLIKIEKLLLQQLSKVFCFVDQVCLCLSRPTYCLMYNPSKSKKPHSPRMSIATVWMDLANMRHAVYGLLGPPRIAGDNRFVGVPDLEFGVDLTRRDRLAA